MSGSQVQGTANIYDADGTLIAAGATVPAGALPVTLTTGLPVNVLNTIYAGGADPAGTADSTAAIQAAINALPAGGGTVRLPAGTYKLTSALTGVTGLTLQGDGSSATTLSQTSTSANGLSGTDLSNITLRGLKIAGPGSGSGIGVSLGISSNGSIPYLRFDDVRVNSFGSHGISLAHPISSAFTQVVTNANGGDGFHITGGTSCAFEGCYANHNTAYGYNLNQLFYSTLAGCACDQNANGYFLNTCQSVTLAGCGAESTTTDSFILSGGKANSLVSCYANGNAHYAVHVTGSETAASVIGFYEKLPGAATNSIITDAGTNATVRSYTVTTPVSLASTPTPAVDLGWQPGDQGLLAWNYDIGGAASGGSTALTTAGTVYVMAVPVRSQISVTNILAVLTVNGATLTAGQCFAALYAGAGGTLIGQTADQASAWGAGAVKVVTMALSGGPFLVQPGIVYVAMWFNGTTGPTFFKTGSSSATANVSLAAAASRFGTANTSVTTTAPGTLGAVSAASNGYWVALS